MHLAFALTRTRLTETRAEFDALLAANEERLVSLEGDTNPSAMAELLGRAAQSTRARSQVTNQEPYSLLVELRVACHRDYVRNFRTLGAADEQHGRVSLSLDAVEGPSATGLAAV